MSEKKELQLGEEIKKKGFREKEKEAGSAWRFPPVCPPSTVKPPPPTLQPRPVQEKAHSIIGNMETFYSAFYAGFMFVNGVIAER